MLGLKGHLVSVAATVVWKQHRRSGNRWPCISIKRSSWTVKFQFHLIFYTSWTAWFLFDLSFKNAKPSFFTRVVQKQVVCPIWPGDHSLLTPDDDGQGMGGVPPMLDRAVSRSKYISGGQWDQRMAVGAETSCGKPGAWDRGLVTATVLSSGTCASLELERLMDSGGRHPWAQTRAPPVIGRIVFFKFP